MRRDTAAHLCKELSALYIELLGYYGNVFEGLLGTLHLVRVSPRSRTLR
jgi:hypothetical protein